MLDILKKQIYFSKMQLLFKKGLDQKRILPFDEEFLEKLDHTFVNGLPVSVYIKYLFGPGKCYDASLYMFYCFERALLVRGNTKALEYSHGKENAGHGWLELDNYVYDSSLMKRVDKDLYYDILQPTVVSKCTKEQYCSTKEREKLYYDITTTTIDDFKPHGKKRTELFTIIPLVMEIAQRQGNQEFITDLNKYLEDIAYDEDEVFKEFSETLKKA